MNVGLILLLIVFFIAFTLILGVNSTIITEFYTLWIAFVAIIAVMIIVVAVLEKETNVTPPVPPTPIVPKTWVTEFVNNTDSINKPLSVISKNENTYTYGYSQGTSEESFMNFFNGTRTEELGGSFELKNNSTNTNKLAYYISKHNDEGVLQWVVKIENGFIVSEYYKGNFITSDDEENIYVVGNFDSSFPVIFYDSIVISGDTPLQKGTLTTDLPATFIAKYNKDGLYQWSTYINGDYCLVKGIDCDINNNLHIIVDNLGTVNYYSNNISTPTSVTFDESYYYISYIKYNKEGIFQNYNIISSNSSSLTRSSTIRTFENNTYIIGIYINPTNLFFYNKNSNTEYFLNLINTGVGTHTFIAKYTNDIINRATKIIDGSDSLTKGQIYNTFLSIDKNENIYVTKTLYTNFSAVYGPTIYIPDQPQENGIQLWDMNNESLINNTFIVKYNSNLVGEWSTKIEGLSEYFDLQILCQLSNSYEDNKDILYTSGNFFNTGGTDLLFYNTINITGTGELIKSINKKLLNGSYIAKYDSDGNLIFIILNNSGNSTLLSNNIFANENYFYNTGTFSSAIDIYQTTSETEPILSYEIPLNERQGYLIKYDKNGVIVN